MKIPPTEFLAKAHSVVLIHQMATSTSEIKGLEGAYSVAKKILKTTRRGSDKEIKSELGREREKTNGNHRCLQTSLGTYEIIDALPRLMMAFLTPVFLNLRTECPT